MTSTSVEHTSEKIVVGNDGSPASLGALQWATRYASMTSETVEVIVVWDWYKSPGWYTPILAGLDPEGDARHVLEKALIEVMS